MIRRGSAVRYDGLTEGGRNRPLRVAVDIAGEEVEAYLKPSHWRETGVEGMANEVFAACVANHLGLPVCEPIIVDLDREWIDVIADAELRSCLARSSPVAFGSVSAGKGWRKWQDDDIVGQSNRLHAQGIFAFDAFTENPDRKRGGNPNLLCKSDQMRIIDHELSFRIRSLLFPPARPWELGNLTRMTNGEGHALAHKLRQGRFHDVSDLRPIWVSLTDDALSAYAAMLPPEWSETAAYIDQAKTHLTTVRDRIDDCLAEVHRVLS